MNIHHLELFYYVARYGGIMEAVRNIPYGIQQPAVSGQVAQLEEYLEVVLFHRRPFALTPAGEKLFHFVQPFFSNLDSVADEIRGGQAHQIRIGSSTLVLRDHLPELCQKVRKKFPNLKITLREGYQAELENWLQNEELDLAITLLEKTSAPGIHSIDLLPEPLPLVLLVPQDSPITSAEELWKRDKILEPLICMPSAEAICKQFQQGLAARGVDWFPSIEVSSVDLIETYVARGFGVGLSVSVPKSNLPPNIRLIPLPDFKPVTLGALWRGKPGSLLQTFLEELSRRGKELFAAALPRSEEASPPRAKPPARQRPGQRPAL